MWGSKNQNGGKRRQRANNVGGDRKQERLKSEELRGPEA